MYKFFLILILIIEFPVNIFSQDLSKNIIADWSFEDSTARDFGKNNYHGVLYNSPEPIRGVNGIGTAFRFRGSGVNETSGSYITLPMIDFNLYPEFSLSFWAKFDSLSWWGGEGYVVFGDHNEGWLGIMCYTDPRVPDPKLAITCAVGSTYTSNPIPPISVDFDMSVVGRWINYVLVYKNETISFYENNKLMGILKQKVYIYGNNAGIARHWWFGGTVTSTRLYGSLDEVKIFNIALHDSDIKKEYEKFTVSITANRDTVCPGDSIRLTAKSGYSKYFWSTGDTSSSITVADLKYIWLKALNKNGDTLFTDYILTIIPNPVPIIIGKKVICGGQPVKLSVQDKYKEILWSNGSTLNSTIINTPGKYSVIVVNDFGCSSVVQFEVTENIAAPLIDGSEVLCDGGTNKLTVKGNYTTYLWNTNSTSKTIFVNKPGVYSVTVTDSSGCTGIASITVTNTSQPVALPASIDFNYIQLGTLSQQIIKIKNILNVDCKINSIKLKNNSSIFSITTDSLLPVLLKKDEILTLTISFMSDQISTFTDTLQFEIESPCYKIYNIPLNGNTYSATVFFPDTQATPSSNNFSIPLYLSVNYDKKAITLYDKCRGYFIRFHYNKFTYFPANKQRSKIESNLISGDDRYIEMRYDSCIDFKNINSDNSKFIIGKLDGNVLYSDIYFTPIVIDTFYWLEPYIITEIKNGSLKILKKCAPDLSQFIYNNKTTFKLNNTQDMLNIEINTIDEGVIQCKIYDLSGNELINNKFHIDKSNINSTFNIHLNIENLPSGMFIVFLKMATDYYINPFIKY